jgi:hypothetical protein
MKLSWILLLYFFNKVVIATDVQHSEKNLLRTRFLQEDTVEVPVPDEEPEPEPELQPLQEPEPELQPQQEPNICPSCVCEFTTNPIEVMVHEDGVDLSLLENKLNNVKGLTVANLVINGLVTCSLLVYVFYKTCV